VPAEIYLNVAVGGLLTGLVYGLMALGLSVIFGVIRVVNFAHGEMMTIAMYLAIVLFNSLGLDPLAMVVPLAAVMFALGYALQAGIINPCFAPLGKAIRACADNHTGALVVGLDVKRLYSLTFGLGAACVGAAGSMLVLLFDVTPALGPALTLLAFIIVITGGLGSMTGALLGGILIGLTEALAGLVFTPSAKSMFSFGLLVLVLLLRPQGLLGKQPT
jgi:branched-subunit amino acid ABC-type transport system permease component